jgi:RNA polymerase sigma factor (sigma-70 family)
MNDENAATRPHDPDITLIQAMTTGDAQALDRLYAHYGPAVFGYLAAWLGNRQLAEEILQDVMLAAWKSAPGFRGESKVLTWLLTIARNRAINAQRRRTPTLVSLDDTFELQGQDTGPLEKIERHARSAAVRRALRSLPDQQREILILTFYHQLTGPEIAEVLDISLGTVKSRLHRAKEMLRHVLHHEGGL